MIDLQKMRAANYARLHGEVDEDSSVVPYTKTDLQDAEVCWKIISLSVRPKMVEATSKNGTTYSKATKDLQFPELMDAVVVGQKKTTAGSKKDIVERTNIDTMRDMYEIRNKMNKFFIQESEDKYTEFFGSVVEVMDAYAQTVVVDCMEADPEFLDKVNAARGCK